MVSAFEYFQGGKDGVIDRLASAIRKGLGKMHVDDCMSLECNLGMPRGTFYRILTETSEEYITSRIVQGLAVPCQLDFQECFKPREDLEESQLQNFAALAELIPIAQAGGGQYEFSERDLLTVCMIDLALEELEKTVPSDGIVAPITKEHDHAN